MINQPKIAHFFILSSGSSEHILNKKFVQPTQWSTDLRFFILALARLNIFTRNLFNLSNDLPT